MLAFLLAPPAARADEAADALLAAAKAATGGAAWDKITTWHETGALKSGGLTGSYEGWIDLPGTRRLGSFQLGALSGSRGWDGKAAWSTDSSGQIRADEAGDAVAEARQDTYGAVLAYWFPERMAAERLYAGERRAEGAVYDAIKITPDGAEPLELWIDRRTHRITRSVQLTGTHPETEIYSDFREIDGVTLPFQVRETTGDRHFDTVSVASLIELDRPIPEARFSPPAPPAKDVAFPPGRDRVTLDVDLIENQLYLPITLNGGRPILALFDTGSLNVLDRSEAKAQDIKEEGALPGEGFGASLAAFGVTKIATLDIGGMTLRNQLFYTLGLSGGSDDGKLVKSAIGYEVAKRAVTVIDYARHQISFIDPAQFQPPPQAAAVPFKFDNHIPVITASLDGISGDFEIDTGAWSSLILMRPFAERHDLAGKYHATREIIAGSGAGGPVRGLLFRPETLTIGPFEIRRPVGNLLADKRGAGADPRIAGNIGGGLLRRFTVTLDYAHQRLYLEKNAAFADPDTADRSGLWLERAAADSVGIADVMAGSPAAKAGLAIGDKIIAIDGTPVSSLTGAALRDKLRASAGTIVTLTVKIGGKSRHVVLTLEDLV